MAFKILNIVRAPGADPEKDKSVIKTDKIEVYTVVADLMKTELLPELCKKYVAEYEIHAVQLCPAVTNDIVGKVTAAVDGKASVFVSRGDFASVMTAVQNTDREWFS